MEAPLARAARVAAAPRGEGLIARLGADAEGVRLAWRILLALLLVYAVSFAAFYPNGATNDDEAQYLRQTRLLLEGRSGVTKVDPLSGATEKEVPSTYPLGVAFSAAPFVSAFGPRGAFAVPFLGLLAAVVITGRWLAEAGRSPLFAALLLGYPPALVLGRVCMSDVPSAAVVALGLWLFWRGQDRGAGWWLAAGLAAGASLSFRVSNPLVFLPLFAGTVLRRERRAWALVAGGLLGLAIRFASMRLYFGDALFERGYYPFGPDSLMERLPLYLLGLLVLVPGGLFFGLAYRGRRRPEVAITFVLFFCFYLFQSFSTIETGPAKRLVLALRYFIPLLPLLCFAMAESLPRLWAGWLERCGPARRPRLEAVAGAAVAIWLVGIGVAAASVHPYLDRWSATQDRIRDLIAQHVGDDVLVTNLPATLKFLHVLDTRYKPLSTLEITPDQLVTLIERHGEFSLVLLDRTDSAYWRGDAERNRRFLAAIEPPPELLWDEVMNPTDRLRIWRVREVRPHVSE